MALSWRVPRTRPLKPVPSLVAIIWHAEIGRGALHLDEFLLGRGGAGPQTVDFTQPSSFCGVGDPLVQALDDASEPDSETE